MPSRSILVFCEGAHDIAFLTRLLAAAGNAVAEENNLANLPEPFGTFFVKRLAARKPNDAKFDTGGLRLYDESPLLDAVWRLSDDSRRWYFLNCHGDCSKNQVNEFLNLVVPLCQISEPDKRVTELGIVFVNDADEIGVEARQKKITDGHAEFLAPILPRFATLKANTVQNCDTYGAGTCVFSKPGSDRGTLEEIVWPMMKNTDPKRHDASFKLIENLASADTKIALDKPLSKRLKAALTVAGQPHNPGSSLAVILRVSPALTAEAMKVDPSSKLFLDVLMNV